MEEKGRGWLLLRGRDGKLRKSNPNRELYSFVYSLAYNYADDAA